MLDVGIIGASGYTGVELARILAVHPEVRLNGPLGTLRIQRNQR